jgi:hypothetical protein
MYKTDGGDAPGMGEAGFEQAAASGADDDNVIDAEFDEAN